MTLLDSRTESPPRSSFRTMQPIAIQSLESDSVQRYASTILDWTDGVEMEVGVPEHRGKEIKLAPGTPIALEVQGADAVLRYTSVVIRRDASPLPSLVVEWPRGGEPFQRRDEFRVPVTLPVGFTFLDDVGEKDLSIVAKTADLSVGGVRVVADRPIPDGQLAEVRIEGPKSEPLVLQGRVIRGGEFKLSSGTVRYWAGVQFTQIAPADRRVLTRFLFEVQRMMRKRES